ncbi:hypothetical protein N7486_007847 [Penicillium sp. IBT 16267x]|nr:hypothetical protein N7486_007847 [Penicillium sp. IBT 16267x]
MGATRREDSWGSPGLIALSDDFACNASDFHTRADLPARDMLAPYCPPADNQPRRYACERDAGIVLPKCDEYAGITLLTCRQLVAPLCLRLSTTDRAAMPTIG